jgi:hypothetical protein
VASRYSPSVYGALKYTANGYVASSHTALAAASSPSCSRARRNRYAMAHANPHMLTRVPATSHCLPSSRPATYMNIGSAGKKTTFCWVRRLPSHL